MRSKTLGINVRVTPEEKEKLLKNFIPSFGKACRAAFMRGISSAGEKSRTA